MFKSIVVPVDGSELSDRALDIAVDLAKALGAGLGICSVVDPIILGGSSPPSHAMDVVLTEVEAQTRRRVDEAVALGRRAGISTHGETLVGVPFDRILEFAQRNRADLIVMGTHGRTGLPRFFIGSVAETVLRKSPCPVLIVREGAQEHEGAS